MKHTETLKTLLPEDAGELIEILQRQRRRNPLPLGLFLALCLNAAIAPAVYATTGGDLTRKSAYALALLGLVILGLAVYLFTVIIQPERF